MQEVPFMSAQLFVVATPIGHLDDMTFRAIDILKSVAVVAAEDTRQSALLFRHYNISTPLTACHDHNESNKIDQLLQRMLKSSQFHQSVNDNFAAHVQMLGIANILKPLIQPTDLMLYFVDWIYSFYFKMTMPFSCC
jgi:precorrin-2 methylase